MNPNSYPTTMEMWEEDMRPDGVRIYRAVCTALWSWPFIGTTSTGNSANLIPSASAVISQLQYRRNTHDEKGDPRSLNPAQEQAWSDSWPIGAMTNDIVWKTAEEIAQAANAYIQLIRMTENTYYSPEAVSEILSALAVYGMVESRTA